MPSPLRGIFTFFSICSLLICGQLFYIYQSQEDPSPTRNVVQHRDQHLIIPWNDYASRAYQTPEDYKGCNVNDVNEFFQCSFQTITTQEERRQLFRILHLLDALLNENGVRYFAVGGTLLGIIRNKGKFIPYDDDIDLYMEEKDRQKVMKLLDAAVNNTRSPYSQLRYANSPTILKVYLHLPVCHRPRKENDYCYPFVDLLVYNITATVGIYQHPLSIIAFKMSHVEPRKRVTLNTVQTWIPNDWKHFIDLQMLYECCTHFYSHRRERDFSCRKCLPCHCLRDWIALP